MCVPKMLVLLVIFGAISWDKSHVMAWSIHPSPSFSSTRNLPSTAVWCPYGKFACSNGQGCIRKSWLCDGIKDCGDNSDEMSWNCISSVETIKPSRATPVALMPSVNYCGYWWWWFRCNNGQCIDRSYVCDGFYHCYDGSDEHSCSSASLVFATIKPSRSMPAGPFSTASYCYWWQFRCNNGQCIDRSYVCDGRYHCYDGSDEHSCSSASPIVTTIKPMSVGPFSTASYCYWWQFRCNNGQCIDRSYVCDGHYHCYDGSDERSCSSASLVFATIKPSRSMSVGPFSTTSYCDWWQFRCDNGQCIDRSYACDGRHHCYDGSDEHSCSSAKNTTKCRNKVDLGFILDSSGSVPRSDFQKMKTFVKDLTNFFTISPEESRVSVMSFSSQVNIHIRFSQRFSNKLNLDYAIDNIGYSGGGTATAMALTSAYNDMFTQRNGGRGTEVKKVLIILTDGHSNTGMVSGPARQLKNSGVVIFSVGIGPYLSMPELYAMASEPTDRHVIRLGTFSQLVALAEQMSSQTCNASHFLVFCDNDFMTAVFDRADLPKHININRLYLRDRRCKATYNSTHAIIETPLTGCGTVYAEDDQTMFFTNTLSEDSFSGGGVITRDYLFKANFTCSYGRKRTVGTFSFEPARQKLSVSIKGAGNFTFALDFYKSNSLIKTFTVNDYPVFKQLSDNIHIQYSVNTTNRDLVVHAESCRATPTNRPYDNPQYVFIADGCDNDSTIRHFGYGMSSVQRFSIQAFRFLTQHRFVYIHCDLVVCNRNYLNSSCARGNTCSRRYRRAVGGASSSSDDGRDKYALSLGPLMYSNKPTVKTTGNSKAQSSMAMIGSVAGVGGVALVLAGALIYVLKRGRLRRVTPTPITHVIPMEQVDASA